MQISTLGPLAVDGRPIRGERLAAVVRELIQARGRTVSTSALVEAVWDGSPPDGATGAVQALVSRARRLGLPVVAGPGGYRVPADQVTVDVVEARALANRARTALGAGDPATARSLADAARALFPEIPELSEVESTRLLADVAALRAEAALAGCGPFAEVDLRRLAERTPPDEPSAALLVRVLAAQGRDAEAAEVVERLRASLAERYGTDPSPVVARAHLALLRGELGATGGPAPRPSPATAPGPVTSPAAGPAPAAGPTPVSVPGPVTSPAAGPAPAAGPTPVSVPGAGSPPAAGPMPGSVPGPVSLPAVGPTSVSEASQPPRRRIALAGLPAAWRRPGAALVGRDGDIAAVTDALAGAPLVTIVASGGAGKTRLAVEIARRSAAAGQPVRVVELAGLRSPDEVLPALLAAIGVADLTQVRADAAPERRVPGLVDRLHAAAGELDGLLVLDNCEHVLEAAATAVAELFTVASPELSVLATSRAPLSLLGEVVHRLRALPDGDALRLLRDRARTGGSALGWDSDKALELCHRLDNLPLALELAGARLRHMPMADVLAGLSDRFALLDDVLRGLPERHASLWAMVDWSRELLSAEDRDLLQRLAVLSAPFTAEAAAAVAGARNVRRGLATLVEHSLLALDEGDDAVPRYRMLETVREYGEVRLDGAGQRDDAMAGLVGWARTHAATLIPDFIGPGQLAAFARCAAEQDNLVAALRWSASHGDEAGAVDVATALFHLWTVRGLHTEVVAWARVLMHLDDPLARRNSVILHGAAAFGPVSGAAASGPVSPAAAGGAVPDVVVAGPSPAAGGGPALDAAASGLVPDTAATGSVSPAATGGAMPDADRLAWLCLFVCINGGVLSGHRLFVLGGRALRRLLAERPGEVSRRATALTKILPLLRSPDLEAGLETVAGMLVDPDPYVRACGLMLRAMVRENRGMPAPSADDGERAYRLFEEAGDHWGRGMAAQNLGEWLSSRGEPGAHDWLRRSARHLELIGAAQDVWSIRVLLDIRLALDGDQDAARRLVEVVGSAEANELIGGQARLGLAQIAAQQGRREEALTHANAVLEILEASSLPVPQVRVFFRVGVAILYLRVAAPGDLASARAVRLLILARDEALSVQDVPVLGSWALGGAALAAQCGDAELAGELWNLGVRLGANVVSLFPHGYGERLAVALGEEGNREPSSAGWGDRSVAEASDRIRELMAELLERHAEPDPLR